MPDFYDRKTGVVRSLNFYNSYGEYTHTAKVAYTSAGKPHPRDIRKNMPVGGGWSVPEYDNNPKAPKQEK